MMRGDRDAWDYFLADRLHMTVAQVQAMSNAEYVGWQAWHEVRGVMQDLAARTPWMA